MNADTGSRTPIAEMVAQMLADGAAAEVIVAAVATAEGAAQRTVTTRAKRGERLPANWHPSDAAVAFAVDRGLARAQVGVEAEKFKNYWSAKTGQGATKLDWDATWRNWIISTVERTHGAASNKPARAHPAAGPATTGADAILAGMGRLAHRVDEKRAAARSGDQQAAHDADAPLQLDLERGGAT
jgi:hypothetical protein